MVEVNRTNFNELFEGIVEDCTKADFIAFDLEYTGIELTSQGKYSLFNSSQERYTNIKECLEQTTTVQFGLATFHREAISMSKFQFVANVYNFILMPSTFEPLKCNFVCSAPALEFLRTHGLDFNKVIDGGISFLNSNEMKTLRGILEDSSDRVEYFKEIEENHLLLQFSEIFDWLAKEGNVEPLILESIQGVNFYHHQTVIRKKFQDVWTERLGSNQIRVFKVDSSNRFLKELNEIRMHRNSTKFEFCNEVLGFSRLFKELINMKKPIVGHNCLLDFIAMYSKFHEPLPADISDYIYSINRMFPIVYDTKHIVYRLRRKFPSLLSSCTGLASVYEKLVGDNNERGLYAINITTESAGTNSLKFNVLHSRFSSDASKFAHEAGFDAYMAGVTLLHLSHVLYLKEKKLAQFADPSQGDTISAGPSLNPSFQAYQRLLEPYKNIVNIIRAREDSIYLDQNHNKNNGSSSRPPYLVICKRLIPLLAKEGVVLEEDFELSQQSVANLLAEYGQADVRRLNNDTSNPSFLVAMSNHSGARAIVREFRKHPYLCIRLYSTLKDNRLVQNSILGAAIVSTTFSGIALASMVVGF